jgi:4-hydroxybenzoate polyprenyltransferase
MCGLTLAIFSLTASAIYVINDIADIEADRHHPRKRFRPFAAGDLSISAGVVTAGSLLILAFALALSIAPWSLTFVMCMYVIVTIAYSLFLKRQPVIDVFVLTALYVLRIVAGGVATSTPVSSWLLAFALFLFLSLAFVKRYSEVVITSGELAGRGYRREDGLWMHTIGTCAGYMAVLVLALYVNSPDVTVLYKRPQIMWFLCPVLLYWITRLWFRASRGSVDDDPVLDSLRDPTSYVIGVIALFALIAAI